MAIFIVQMFYGIMAISTSNNNEVERAQVKEEFTLDNGEEAEEVKEGEEEDESMQIDMILYNLNEYQHNIVANYNNNVIDKAAAESFYIILKDVPYRNDIDQENRYDMYLHFSDYETNEARDKFVKNYIEDTMTVYGTVNYEETDLINFDQNIAANNVTFGIISLALLAVSVFLLIALYNIRINQYKFTYGIYMTVGADFKRLFGTAFWELFLISLITYLPAMICSTVTVWIIYLSSGFPFVFFAVDKWLLVAIFSLVVVTISVISPMRIMSLRTPMSLLRTEDNSNYVTSPRRSFNLVGKSFPAHYEIYSIWRFRKYNIQLLTSAIAFCALFIMGLYLGNIYDTSIEFSKPQYTIDLSETNFHYNAGAMEDGDKNAISSDVFLGIEGIKFVEQTGNSQGNFSGEEENFSSPMTEANYISSHAVFPTNRARLLTNFLSKKVDGDDRSWKATNEVVYKSVDSGQIHYLNQFTASYLDEAKGLEKVLDTDQKYVIVGDSISNMKKFNIKPGDTIMAATKIGQEKDVDSNATGRALLRQQLQYFEYEYTEFVVAAVIHDIPCSSLPIYMLGDDYEKVTGINADANLLNIYTDPAVVTNNDQVLAIMDEIKEIGFDQIGTINVANNRRIALQQIAADKHNSELFVVISVLILVISPLIWFFNQILYYRKREKEFNIIQSMGAKVSDIRKIYLLGGLSMAIMSLVVSIALSYLASYGVYYFVNAILPDLNHDIIRYQFYLPWYALVISALLSVGCGFFSTYLPYRTYFKERFSLENGGSGMKDDE